MNTKPYPFEGMKVVYLNDDAFEVDEAEYDKRFNQAKLEADVDLYVQLSEWIELTGRYLGRAINS